MKKSTNNSKNTMSNGNNVIGISRFETIKDYTISHGGSFFRQFVLVSNGELPSQFHLHGKVECCAIGRIGERLFYVTCAIKKPFGALPMPCANMASPTPYISPQA